MKEHYYDQLLNVQTSKMQMGFNKSYHYHRYEPTPYSALELLFLKYPLKSSDRIVDFGCGKGRMNFFINYLFNATVVGVEMNESLYKIALENQNHYLKKFKNRSDKIIFQCGLAEDYQIDEKDNRFYFFNPFSLQIFMNIINKILVSMEKSKREMDVVLYYPSEDYLYYLNNQTSFELIDEVLLEPFYHQDPYEKFMIYRLEICE